MEALAHLIMIASKCPGGRDNKEDLENVQHAELGRDQKHTIKDGDEASQGCYLPG